jgi:hypothetical protein
MTAASDSGLDWCLRGPDVERKVWLDRVELDDLPLGPAEAVRARLSAFCAGGKSDTVPAAETALVWDLDGPDAGGVVSLVWNGPEPQDFRLGHVDQVRAGFQHWLGSAGN